MLYRFRLLLTTVLWQMTLAVQSQVLESRKRQILL
nr:MAG TPA: hypothetical protein [Caudoviricetes sp.]